MNPRLVQSFPSFLTILQISAILRIALILYSEWHDSRSVVKYTDVDYRVFSDAARFLLHPGPGNIAQGPLGQWVGDPYKRETYRYTPLLAVLLAPNEWIHPSFGKYLFALCDLINGVLINSLLCHIILPSIATKPAPKRLDASNERTAAFFTAFHLLNPLVFSISTRGSAESVLSLLVLLALYYALKGRWDAAAVILGVSTHWKIYPFIYGVGCLGVIAGGREVTWKGHFGGLVTWRTVRFTVVSAGTFLALGLACYIVWGYPFLYEAYLYHLHRLDHRHNFSPYFYLTYLTYPFISDQSTATALPPPLWRRLIRLPLTSFVPQMTLSLGTGLLFGRHRDDLVFTWFVQTAVFVLFNKVCTSQYFLWYLLLLPLLLPKLSITPRRTLAYLMVWIATQVLWLIEAYRLEFLGENVFYSLWVRSLIYVAGNAWVLAGIMDGYARGDST